MDSARHVIQRLVNHRLLIEMASYDVASTIHQSLVRGACSDDRPVHPYLPRGADVGRACHLTRIARHVIGWSQTPGRHCSPHHRMWPRGLAPGTYCSPRHGMEPGTWHILLATSSYWAWQGRHVIGCRLLVDDAADNVCWPLDLG
jgi:hypothetical protein